MSDSESDIGIYVDKYEIITKEQKEIEKMELDFSQFDIADLNFLDYFSDSQSDFLSNSDSETDSHSNKKQKGTTSTVHIKIEDNYDYISTPITFTDKIIVKESKLNCYKSYCGEKFLERGTNNVKYCGKFHGVHDQFCRKMAKFKCIECDYDDTYNNMLNNHPHFLISSHHWDSKILSLHISKFPLPKKVFHLKIIQNGKVFFHFPYKRDMNFRSNFEKGFNSKVILGDDYSKVELKSTEESKNKIDLKSVHPTFILK
jgi:hypothetical protein